MRNVEVSTLREQCMKAKEENLSIELDLQLLNKKNQMLLGNGLQSLSLKQLKDLFYSQRKAAKKIQDAIIETTIIAKMKNVSDESFLLCY